METEIKEYRYNLTARPFSIGTYPSESKFGFLRFEENDRFGTVIYSKKLPLEKVKNYELSPITDIFIYDGKKMLFHNKFPAKIEVKVNERNRSYVSIIPEKEGVKNIQMGSIDFLEELENGKHTIIDDSEAKETEKPKIGNIFGDLVLDKLEKAFEQKFPNDKFQREALIKSWNETKNERGNTNRANENLADIYLSYFNSDLRAKIYSDLINEAKELEKSVENNNKKKINLKEFNKNIFLTRKVNTKKYRLLEGLYENQNEKFKNSEFYFLLGKDSKIVDALNEKGFFIGNLENLGLVLIVDVDRNIVQDLVNLKSNNIGLTDLGIESFKEGGYDFINNESKELEKGIAVEQEHLKTFEKVAAGDITPEQAIVETAQEHIAENPKYYDELEKIETPKIETMKETKLGNDDWAKIPAQNKYATPVKSKAYQYSPYDKTFQDITDNFVGSDKFRPVFSGVFFNELGICTTDSHKLLYINHISDKYSGDYCVTPKCKKIVGEYSIKDDKIDGKFPQYQNIIPNESIFVYDIDLLSLKTYCEIVIRSGFVNATTNRIALTFDDKKIFGINGKFLIEGIESFLIMGHRKVKVGLTTQNRAMLFVADNNYDGTESPIGKSDFFLIMPLMSDSKEKEFNYAFMQGDIDFDNLLNIAYSLEKDAVITKGGEVFHKIDTSITKSDVKDAGELNLEQLQIAASFIKASKNSSLPILNTVKIENNTLNISNLEQAYSISDVKMPNGIYEIRGTALFPTKYDIDDFPKMPSDFKKVGQINRQELIKNFEHCLDFVGDDDLRPVMEGVHFYKDSMNLVIESTDAHALYRNEIKNYNIDSEFNIIITKPKLVYKVLESFDCDEIDFYIQESGKNAYFECGTGKIYFFIESGRYPNTEAVYPRDYEKKVVFEAKDFKKLESDIKRLAKKGGFKIDDVNAMFNFTESGIANYTIAHSKGYGSEVKEYEELESGSIKCEVKEDYSSLYSTFKTLIMPVLIKDKNFDLGFKTFNLNRLSSLGFDKVELAYTKPERAVVVLNEFVLTGVKTVPNQKKKEVKKKVVEPIVEPIIETKPEIVIEDSEEVKEWKEAIENLNYLLNEGGTDAENTEWREAIDNLNYLIKETPKMAKGGGVESEKVKEGDILISNYSDYYKLIKLGNGYFEVGKLDIHNKIKKFINIPEDFSEQSLFKKANKEELEDFYNDINTDEDYAKGGGIKKVETVLWATKKGMPDWEEQMITNNPDVIEDAKKWALANGFDRIRVSKIEMFEKPDFSKGINKMAKGGGVGEPYDSMTKYQLDKEYKKLNEKRNLLQNKYGTFQSDEIIQNEKEIDKIITLLYGENFSGVGQKFKYAKGGYLANENALMVANNNKQIFHHTKEMAEALKGAKNIPAWVVAKVNRSASDLSDATHYLEGAEGMYAEGGEMGQYRMETGGKINFKPITTPL